MFQSTPANPAVITVLLLNLTIVLLVTSEYKESSFKRLVPGYSYSYIGSPSEEKFLPCQSALQCAAISLQSDSAFFSYNKESRLCKNYSLNIKLTVNNTQNNNEQFFYRIDKWINVYAAPMKTGVNIYNSFLKKGNFSSWYLNECKDTLCPSFFRHSIIDSWNYLPIDKVKLVIYKNQSAIIDMVFEGQNTTIENWFSITNLKSSPWDNLSADKAPVFSIKGNNLSRFFYIGRFGNTCLEDHGWLIVIQKYVFCQYEALQHYPSIFYANTNSGTFWNNGSEAVDSLAIFIRLRSN